MKRRHFLKSVGLGLAATQLCGGPRALCAADSGKKPNVILVMTDDQGYGDLGCHGNPWIKTPSLDSLYAESVRLTDFHVSPLCSPTRASLMTGRHCRHVGIMGTNNCTNFLARDVQTVADIFHANGYRTGQFGKWHLGDHYPHRPHERGFDEAIYHGNGAITAIGDVDWHNDYFDDVYEHNGERRKFEGYCTDIWFREAMRFIQSSGDDPFLCYIAPNAPHAPYLVDKKYSDPYTRFTSDVWHPEYYGMITNFDENMGRLLAFLREQDLEQNTILIFMTDNGSVGNNFKYPDLQDPNAYRPVLSQLAAGTAANPAELAQGYNAGMRGQKASAYDGGHRVPFFLRWPAGELQAGRDVPQLAAHIDVFPTLVDLCGLESFQGVVYDGISLRPWLQSGAVEKAERSLVESFSGTVLTARWRLVHDNELYDIVADPQQLTDVAAQNPEVVHVLRAELDRCRSKDIHVMQPIILGSERQPLVWLTPEQWLGLERGLERSDVMNGSLINGHLQVSFAHSGTYEFTLNRWPQELNLTFGEIPAGGTPQNITMARLKINELELVKEVTEHQTGVTFTLPVEAGEARMETALVRAGGGESGAYYVRVLRL